MKTRHFFFYFVYLVFFVAKSDVGAAETVDHAAVLTPFLNDDTFAAVYLDVASLPKNGNSTEIFRLLPMLPETAQMPLLGAMMVNGLIDKFQAAGGQGVYLVAGLLDIYDEGGPLVIATTARSKHPEEVEQFFHDLIQELHDSRQFTNPPLATILDVRRQGNVVLFGTKHTLSRYASIKPSQRNDIIEPLTRLTGEGAVLVAIDAAGPDCRRVFRELWPALPPPMSAATPDLADRWRTFEFAANLPPNVNPRLILQAADPAAAQTFVDLYRAIPAAIDQFDHPGKDHDEVKRYVDLLMAMLTPQIDGTRVTLTLSAAKPQLDNLNAMFSSLTDKALESSRRRDRMDRFRQLLIAMFNYADANKHFPPAAICDMDGKPLLSWRVAILPFLDEGKELYRQFHLDEPWDSPHNSALIGKMPAVFADPDPKVRQAAGNGKTTFQVPVAAETIFFNNDGTKFSQITDGTSRTIMLVEVDPLLAAAWTRPEDWHVDIDHPRRGIERKDRNIITAGFADGHVEALRADIDDAALRAQLTRAGRD